MRRVIFVSGAGLSADSGIRTFRTDTDSGRALWEEYDLEEVCDIGAFQAGYRVRTSPDLPVVGGVDENGMDLYAKTHEFYNKRRVELKDVQPNTAHIQIAKWFKEYPNQVVNLTTNVDDLLERAGVDRDSVIHVHGYLPEVVYRMHPGDYKTLVDIGYNSINIDDYNWVKPNVVFFGEAAPLYADMAHLFDTLTMQDLVVVVGCSNQVINFNWELFPALSMGTKMIVVNPGINYEETLLYEDRGVFVYREKAADAFSNPAFIKMIEDHLTK